MSTYGSFVYGYGYVYGTAVSAVTDASFLNANVIEVTLTTDVVVDDAYYSLDNYSLAVIYGNPISIRKVLENKIPTKVTNKVYLVTDVSVEGSAYSVSVSNLNNRDGSHITPSEAIVYPRRSKTDSVLQSLPAHFDKRPEAIVKNILTAITRSDEEIGGSRDEEV
jgi:hypothetical protein